MDSLNLNIKGCTVHVTISGEGAPLLCLHGWGGSHESFTELHAALKNQPFQIIAPDLPGFGESSEPSEAWSVGDYADFVEELIKKMRNQESEKWRVKSEKFLLLGHSFGGRIAIKLAARQSFCHPEYSRRINKSKWIAHLFLCAAAGIKHKKHIRRTISIAVAETGKLLFRIPGLKSLENIARKVLYKILRVHDYEQASERMRETMIKTINEDLTPLLEKITIPTDIFWGTKDAITPYSDAKKMNKKIIQSTLHTYTGIRHKVHRDRAEEIGEILISVNREG